MGVGALGVRVWGIRFQVSGCESGVYITRDREKEFFIDNLLVRIHFIIEMIWWTGLAPWRLEFRFPGSLMYLPSTGGIYCKGRAAAWRSAPLSLSVSLSLSRSLSLSYPTCQTGSERVPTGVPRS